MNASPAPVGSFSTTGSVALRITSPSHDISAPSSPCLTHTTWKRRDSSSTAAAPRRSVSSSASRSFASSIVAGAHARRNRSAPNERIIGHDAASTATNRARARSRAATPAAEVGSNSSEYPDTRTAPASRRSGRSSGESRPPAPRSATIERSRGSWTTSIVPVSAVRSIARAGSTPRAISSSRRSAPATSEPIRPWTRDVAPASTAHTAALAALPPGRTRTRPCTSPPSSSPSESTRTSIITSPTVTTSIALQPTGYGFGDESRDAPARRACLHPTPGRGRRGGVPSRGAFESEAASALVVSPRDRRGLPRHARPAAGRVVPDLPQRGRRAGGMREPRAHRVRQPAERVSRVLGLRPTRNVRGS